MDIDKVRKGYCFNKYKCIDLKNTLKQCLLLVLTCAGHQEVNFKDVVEVMMDWFVLPNFTLRKSWNSWF